MTPEGWRRVHLSEVANQRIDKVVPAKTDKRPYVALEHLAQGSPALLGWAQASAATSAKTVFRTGDVLFGKLRPYLHKAAPAPFDGLCSTDILPLYGRSTLDTRYLAQLAQWRSLQRHAVATSSGTKMPRTSWPQLGAFTFPLPPLPEQRKIAAILSSVDDAIEKTQAVIDQVQVVKRGLMQELLTRGLPGRHTRFKQTEIGRIPEEWQLKRLSEVASVQTGLAKNKANAGPLSVSYLRVANVQDGFVDLAEVKAVEVNPNALTRFALRPADVLFTEGGDAELGRGAVWNGEMACLHQNHVFVASSHSGTSGPCSCHSRQRSERQRKIVFSERRSKRSRRQSRKSVKVACSSGRIPVPIHGAWPASGGCDGSAGGPESGSRDAAASRSFSGARRSFDDLDRTTRAGGRTTRDLGGTTRAGPHHPGMDRTTRDLDRTTRDRGRCEATQRRRLKKQSAGPPAIRAGVHTDFAPSRTGRKGEVSTGDRPGRRRPARFPTCPPRSTRPTPSAPSTACPDCAAPSK